MKRLAILLVLFVLTTVGCQVLEQAASESGTGILRGDFGHSVRTSVMLLEVDLPEDAYTIDDLNAAADVMSRRVAGLGITTSDVRVEGNRCVVVSLSGVEDLDAVIPTLIQSRLLELVDFSGLWGSNMESLIGQHILTDRQLALEQQRIARVGEQDAEVTPEPTDERLLNPTTGYFFHTVLTGDFVRTAVAEYNSQMNQWTIRFELTDEGGEIFGDFTGSHINEPVAIVLDGEVRSAPTIRDRLTTGGVILGNFTEDEAKALALQLRSGALPVPLRVVEVRDSADGQLDLSGCE